MVEDQDENINDNRIKAFDVRQVAAFAAACCERAAPACQPYFVQLGIPIPTIFADGLDSIWQFALGDAKTNNYGNLATQIEENIPDLDNCVPGDIAKKAAYVQYTACSIINGILLCANSEQAISFASLVKKGCLDLIDSWLQNELYSNQKTSAYMAGLRGKSSDEIRTVLNRVTDERFVAKHQHPTYQQELARQAADIIEIASHPMSVQFIKQLRSRAALVSSLPLAIS